MTTADLDLLNAQNLAREMLAIRDADPTEGVFDPEFAEFAEKLAEAILDLTPC